MNYKIIIDPYRGGTDIGVSNSEIIEKKFNLEVSLALEKYLKSKGVNASITRNEDKLLTDDERISKINSLYDANTNIIVISNRLNNGVTGGVEINYALRNNSKLASTIAKDLTDDGFAVNKYYQKRDENSTSDDADIIIRETNPDQTIIIYYGYINNQEDKMKLQNPNLFALAVGEGIINYLGIADETYYIVQPKDTLYSISKKNNITINELKELNNLETNTLMIGQKLKINNNNDTYTVVKGDSLYAISKKYNTTVEKLKQFNNLTSNTLSIGQVLNIPAQSTNTHTVIKGDTLYSIAKKHDISIEKLKKYNDLKSNILFIGQILKIPS